MKRLFAIWVIVFLLLPIFVFAQEEDLNQCVECSEPGGFVPCGRKCDDPLTDKNECLPCTLCDFFVMADRGVDFALKPGIAVLAILIIAVIITTAYARARSAPESINKAKKALMGVVIGLIIIYAAWVIVNTVLVAFGAATWSGVNDLWVINCSSPETKNIELVKTFCGDGTIQRPNNDDFVEICDSSDLGGRTCQNRGFESGNLACKNDCSGFDESKCVAYPPPKALSLPALAPRDPEPLDPLPEGYYCPKDPSGIWCGLGWGWDCGGHDPDHGCPDDFHKESFYMGEHYGGQWNICVSDSESLVSVPDGTWCGLGWGWDCGGKDPDHSCPPGYKNENFYMGRLGGTWNICVVSGGPLVAESGTWCGLGWDWDCGGKDPDHSCPPGYKNENFYMGDLGGTWNICVKNF